MESLRYGGVTVQTIRLDKPDRAPLRGDDTLNLDKPDFGLDALVPGPCDEKAVGDGIGLLEVILVLLLVCGCAATVFMLFGAAAQLAAETQQHPTTAHAGAAR